MAAKHARHIAPTGPLVACVKDQVAGSEYTSPNETVRTALRLLIERDEAKARGAVPAASVEVVHDRA